MTAGSSNSRLRFIDLGFEGWEAIAVRREDLSLREIVESRFKKSLELP